MDIIAHGLIGMAMTYLGLLPPGMMNMTVVHHSMDKGVRQALRFAAGASTVVLVQAGIALVFAQWLTDRPEVIELLKKIAIGVFIILAIYFYRLASMPRKQQEVGGSSRLYWSGVGISSMNMLAIPFFLGYSTWMELSGWISIQFPYITGFVIGAAIGSFALFLSYAYLAEWISRRARFIARNIHYILSLLFLILAVITTFTVFST